MNGSPPSSDEAMPLRPPAVWKRRTAGGVVAFVGYILSPLSWWNDAFVNIPIAWAFASVVTLFYKPAFDASFVLGYWLTNVIGMVMMHKGAQKMLTKEDRKYRWRDAARDIGISLLYTGLIVFLLKLHILKPIGNYLHK